MSIVNRQELNAQYYDLRIFNEIGGKTASFDKTRINTILENPSSFDINVNSFRIPLEGIPLLEFEDNKYFITIEFEGVSVTKPLLYVPSNVGPFVFSKPVYQYAVFIEMINNALGKSFSELKILKPLLPATTQPYIIEGELFSMNTEIGFISNSANPVDIFFNKELMILFSFRKFQVNIDKYKILVQDLFTNEFTNNGLQYYRMTQSVPTNFLWGDFDRIAFQTSSIPLDSELVGGAQDIRRSVLTDFIIGESGNRAQELIFQPSGPLRLISLNSQYPMRQIDVQIIWIDKKGKSNPLILPIGTVAYVKLAMLRKEHQNLLNLDDKGYVF